MKETTKILHQGDTPEKYQGAVNPPVFRASLFGYTTYQAFREAFADSHHRPVYNRGFNPTVNVVEQKITTLYCSRPQFELFMGHR